MFEQYQITTDPIADSIALSAIFAALPLRASDGTVVPSGCIQQRGAS